MCGSSKGSSAPPPSPPPTTFNYTAADKSNTRQRQAATIGTTNPQTSLGSDLGTGTTSSATPTQPGGL